MTKSTFYHDGYRDYERHNPLSVPHDQAPACEYSRGWIDAANIHLAAQDMLAALEGLLAWGREHTSPRDTNSPHALLVTAAAAVHKAKGG